MRKKSTETRVKRKMDIYCMRPIIDLDNRLNVTIKKTEIFFFFFFFFFVSSFGNNETAWNLIFSQFETVILQMDDSR